jgi:superfamily II DNA/RNA helicase
MKSEDYTHRIGRTGRAGRDGLAVTFAEHRERRKIGDIEAYSRQRFTAEMIPGLEPQARPAPAPRRDFGGKGRPGGGGGGYRQGNGGGDRGNGYGKHAGFGAKSFERREGGGHARPARPAR